MKPTKQLENKIRVTGGLVKKTDYNAKITEIENKIMSINGLATNAALIGIENKIPNINGLVNKADYNKKISEVEENVTDNNHDNHITTPEFNKISAEAFDSRLVQANLATKTDLMINLKAKINKSTQMKQGIYLLKMNLKS